jgi:hypothetical protein
MFHTKMLVIRKLGVGYLRTLYYHIYKSENVLKCNIIKKATIDLLQLNTMYLWKIPIYQNIEEHCFTSSKTI